MVAISESVDLTVIFDSAAFAASLYRLRCEYVLLRANNNITSGGNLVEIVSVCLRGGILGGRFGPNKSTVSEQAINLKKNRGGDVGV